MYAMILNVSGGEAMASSEKRARGAMEQLKRVSKHKLVIPLKRSPHSPQYSARSVAVGMFWAMTPLVGIQMPLCFITWLAFRPFKNLRHSLIISCAWTWVTNVATMVPIYYLFYVTGQIMIGNANDITGYHAFRHAWHDSFSADMPIWQSVLELVALLARELGIAMSIGCLPYAIAGAWISYVLSLKYVRRRRRLLMEKRARMAAERRAAAAEAPST